MSPTEPWPELPARIEATEAERLQAYIEILEADRARDQVRLADQAALLRRMEATYQQAVGLAASLRRLLGSVL